MESHLDTSYVERKAFRHFLNVCIAILDKRQARIKLWAFVGNMYSFGLTSSTDTTSTTAANLVSSTCRKGMRFFPLESALAISAEAEFKACVCGQCGV